MPPPPPPTKKERHNKFDRYELEALQRAGLKTDKLIYTVKGDLDEDANYCDTFVCFDVDGLYLAFGKEELVKKEHLQKLTKKQPVPEITIDKIAAYPASEIERLYIEQFVSTARLIAKTPGGELALTRFTAARLEDFNELVHIYNDVKDGKPAPPKKDKDGAKCRKCGKPCPPGKDLCRKCDRKSGSTTKRLFSYFGRYYPVVIIATLTVLAGTVFNLAVPQVGTRMLFDRVLSNPDGKAETELIKALGVLILQMFVLRFSHVLMNSAREYLLASITPKVVYDIKIKIFEAMQNLSVGFYNSKQTGSLMERVSRDSNNIYFFLINDMPDVFTCSLTIIGIFAIMFKMSPQLAVIILIIAPVLTAVMIFGDRIFRSLHHNHWMTNSNLSSLVSDNINGQRVIKAFAREDSETDRFGGASGNLRDAEMKLGQTEATIYPFFTAFVLATSTLILARGGILALEGVMTVGTLLSFIVYVEQLADPIGTLSRIANRWTRCLDSARRVFEIVDAIPDITEKPDAKPLGDFKGEVELCGVEFEYEPARPIIRDLSMHVNPGEMLGIVGKTGAGKTTIVNLISRLYDCKRGTVMLDGTDVRDLRLTDIRKNVGMVSQDIYLFIGSIADNIRYAKPDATMEEVIAAAKAAAAHDFIMKLPDAYETWVGAGGQSLSGGERQRISIARTIIQNPKLLILDEATAAMDTETEQKIQDSISALKDGRTTIAIAHRLSTLRDSDHLAVIDNGKITEYGTYTELLAKKGDFYKLYKIQAEALSAIGIAED